MANTDGILPAAQEIGRDLLNIEINTVEKENMSARKMPIFPHALIDIAECYLHKLVKLGLDMPLFWNLAPDERKTAQIKSLREQVHPELLKLDLYTGQDTFDKLRWAAARALWDDLALPDEKRRYSDADRVILDRIRRNCDQIKNMIRVLTESEESEDRNKWQGWLNDDISRQELIDEKYRKKPLGRLPLDYAVAIRKIWDVGVEKVIMQTVVQIDGDVITRIQAGLDDAVRERLLEIHNRGVDTGLTHWKSLLDVVKEIAGTLVDLFMPSRNIR